MARWDVRMDTPEGTRGFEQVVRNGRGQGHATLEDLFRLAAEVAGYLPKSASSMSRGPAFLQGRVRPIDGPALPETVREAERVLPLALRAPFEGCEEIAGDVWRGSQLLGRSPGDGLALLRFEARAIDLVAHAHEESERVVLVIEGHGVFHATEERLKEFTGTKMTRVDLHAGDLVAFSRGLVHTFSAPSSGLLLLSYHSDFMEFEDARQYTPATTRWWPHPEL